MSLDTDHASGFAATAVDPLRYGGQTPEPWESPGMVLGLIPRGARVLDVGCGTGSISRMIRDFREAEVVGLEPHPERARAAAESGLEVINDLFLEDAVAHLRPFDVVVFADVLEHLVDPSAALRMAKARLAPGGAVVASVPNIAHWSVRLELLRGNFNYRDVGIMDATHLRWFTAENLRRLFESAGFRITSLQSSAGLWMWDYFNRRPWIWMERGKRERFVRWAVQKWPGFFGCQYVVKAEPERAS